MKTAARFLLTLPFALLLLVPPALAQDDPREASEESAETVQVFSQAELDQMLAPIALYPDALLSQILMAATYPLEVVQAARWSRAHPGLKGEQAVNAVAEEGWDPSVKALVAFPQVLYMMDEKLEWTQGLGDAFLAQQTQVMDTVQNLRQRAYDAGNLQSSAKYRVERRDGDIVILPAAPEVVYVPYYDPRVVYGPWWWAGYPPVYWQPWPGYYPYAGTHFFWSVGVFVGDPFFFGFWDWPHRHIIVVEREVVRPFHRHKLPTKVWRHDPKHRHGVRHRHPLVDKKFAAPHVRMRSDAGRDPAKWRAAPQDSSTWRERGDVTRPGIGRLGPRHDKLTARPEVGRTLPGKATVEPHARWRPNAPTIRPAPQPPKVQRVLPGHQRQPGSIAPSGRAFSAPKARGFSTPAPTGRSFSAPSFSGPPKLRALQR